MKTMKQLLCRFTKCHILRSAQFTTNEESKTELKRGLLVGVYAEEHSNVNELSLTPTAEKFNEHTGGKLMDELRKVNKHCILSNGALLFHHLDPNFLSVAIVNLGKKSIDEEQRLDVEEWKEGIRLAASIGTRELCKQGITHILMEGLGHAQCAAEGAYMSVWRFQHRSSPDDVQLEPSLELYEDEEDKSGWEKGLCIAKARSCTLELFDSISAEKKSSSTNA